MLPDFLKLKLFTKLLCEKVSYRCAAAVCSDYRAVSKKKTLNIFQILKHSLYKNQKPVSNTGLSMCGRGDSNSHARLKALPPQSSASTNFATSAFWSKDRAANLIEIQSLKDQAGNDIRNVVPLPGSEDFTKSCPL